MSSDEDKIKTCSTVSKGEVCSLAIAEELGIRGDDVRHYKNGYDDIKTYSCLSEINKPYNLCEINGKPICLLQKDAGFGFTADPSDSTCVTSECPPGFKEDPNDRDVCIKPFHEANAVRASRIDERWYDWFMISNYHLGNKYGKDELEKNYKPCKSGSVPLFKTDPVDNTINTTLDKEALSKCINKKNYFEGKYDDTPDYCPLAWIIRSGATTDDYTTMYNALIDNIILTNGESDNTHSLKENAGTHIKNDIIDKMKDEKYAEYAGSYDSEEVEFACKKLEVDLERLAVPYEICARNHNGKKEDIINELIAKNGLNQTQAEKMYLRTRQACHTVFSDPNGAVAEIKKPALYFEDVLKINIDYEIGKKKEPEPIITTNENDISIFKNTAIYSMLYAVIIIIVSLITFYQRKNIKKLVQYISRNISNFIKYIIEKINWLLNQMSAKRVETEEVRQLSRRV